MPASGQKPAVGGEGDRLDARGKIAIGGGQLARGNVRKTHLAVSVPGRQNGAARRECDRIRPACPWVQEAVEELPSARVPEMDFRVRIGRGRVGSPPRKEGHGQAATVRAESNVSDVPTAGLRTLLGVAE